MCDVPVLIHFIVTNLSSLRFQNHPTDQAEEETFQEKITAGGSEVNYIGLGCLPFFRQSKCNVDSDHLFSSPGFGSRN